MKILVAVDGSEASEAAVQAAKAQPWPSGSQIKVLSVAEPTHPPPPPMAGMGGAYPYPGTETVSLNQELLNQAALVSQRAANELRSTGYEVESVAEFGDPRDAIVNQAREWKADLIVLGSHGRTGLKRWLLGSVAESVVRHAPCSVEVARVPTAA